MLKFIEGRFHLFEIETHSFWSPFEEGDHAFLHHVINFAGRGQVEPVPQLFLGQKMVRIVLHYMHHHGQIDVLLTKMSSDPTNATILDIPKLREGDPNAWNAAYPVLYPIACQAGYRFFKDRAQVEDVAMEAIARMYENRAKLEDEGDLRGLIYTIAWNWADDLKDKQVYRSSDVTIEKVSLEVYEDFEDQDEDPSSIADRNELRASCSELIDRLPKKIREFARDHILGAMTIDEIVNQRKRPRGTVSVYLSRAKELLRVMAANDAQMRERREDYHSKDKPKQSKHIEKPDTHGDE